MYALPSRDLRVAGWHSQLRKLPGGPYCPIGTSTRMAPNCGFGNYCPEGSPAPIACPITIPPGGGSWANHDAESQGPAFIADTAACYELCFWVENGDGTRSGGCPDE